MKLFSSEHDSAVFLLTSFHVHLFLILSIVSGLKQGAAGRMDGEGEGVKGNNEGEGGGGGVK